MKWLENKIEDVISSKCVNRMFTLERQLEGQLSRIESLEKKPVGEVELKAGGIYLIKDSNGGVSQITIKQETKTCVKVSFPPLLSRFRDNGIVWTEKSNFYKVYKILERIK